MKINRTVHVWRELGYDAKACLVSPPPAHGDVLRLESGEVISSPLFKLVPPPFRYRAKYLNKMLAVRKLGRLLKGFAPDIVYFRQTVWFPGLLTALKRAGCPYVIEINSDEEHEYQLRGFFERFVHFNTRQWVFARASGLVAVSREIADKLKVWGLSVAVVANGYDVRSIVPRPVPGNHRVQLLFVGSPGQPWHGVDKIIEFAKLLPEMDFHLVGDRLTTNLPNLFSYGYLEHKDLASLYQTADIGIGTLALSRKRMTEASPLKVREYLAYGLPVVIAYNDTDLGNCPFVLKLEENGGVESNVKALRAFVRDWKDRTIDRAVVLRRIDLHAKEKRRLEFMKKCLDQ